MVAVWVRWGLQGLPVPATARVSQLERVGPTHPSTSGWLDREEVEKGGTPTGGTVQSREFRQRLEAAPHQRKIEPMQVHEGRHKDASPFGREAKDRPWPLDRRHHSRKNPRGKKRYLDPGGNAGKKTWRGRRPVGVQPTGKRHLGGDPPKRRAADRCPGGTAN